MKYVCSKLTNDNECGHLGISNLINMDTKHSWTRSGYSGRGRLQGRDKVMETMLSNACVICGETLERKLTRRKLETIKHWLARKTCGKIMGKNGIYEWSECLRIFRSGEGNSNWKGIDPHCKDCGKKIYTYKAKNATGERCKSCYTKVTQKNGYPEHLKKYGFKKGRIPLHTTKGIPSPFKGISFEKQYGKFIADLMKEKISKTRIERFKSGELKVEKPRVIVNCVVCKKEVLCIPYRAKTRKTCGLKCNGVLGGTTKKHSRKLQLI